MKERALIFMIEDNPGDVMLFEECLSEAGASFKLIAAEDGIKALVQLEEFKESSTIPNLIILDLNLPKLDGRALLDIIKSDPVFGIVPVIVFSSSGTELDINNSYELHASCYIKKPSNLNDFLMVVKCIYEFWLKIVKLPTSMGGRYANYSCKSSS